MRLAIVIRLLFVPWKGSIRCEGIVRAQIPRRRVRQVTPVSYVARNFGNTDVVRVYVSSNHCLIDRMHPSVLPNDLHENCGCL